METKNWMEVVEKSYQFYVYLFTIFVICMGLARWYGKQVWRKREEIRRRQNKLPVAAFLSTGSPEQSFTYSGLFQGGLNGLCLGLIVMMYVAIMLAVLSYSAMSMEPPVQPDIWAAISALMIYPVGMTAFFAASETGAFRKPTALSGKWPVIIIVVLAVTGTVAAVLVLNDKKIVVAAESCATAALLLCSSYLVGMSEGISLANPEGTYPLVNIELTEGTTFNTVWLYERTDSDYRLVTENGTNHIIPAVNVRQITKA